MSTTNEQVVREGYAIAERQDAEGFIGHFERQGSVPHPPRMPPPQDTHHGCAQRPHRADFRQKRAGRSIFSIAEPIAYGE